MFGRIGRRILGSKLASNQLGNEKFSVFWGLPILASDAISSVAYAVDEILWALIPAIGLLSYLWVPEIAGVIIFLLLVLTISYRQIVDAYPGGGGAYIVAKENLKTIYGLIVGASLSVDYVLTVAVSISAGSAAIISAFPSLYHYRVEIAIAIIFLMVIGNLRGIRESSRWFSLPTYAFMATMVTLIIAGIIKGGNNTAGLPPSQISDVTFGTQAVTIFLLLRAFSSGCAAVTGVEAIADAAPNFKAPPEKNAKLAYILLAVSVLITFGGIAYLSTIYHPVPSAQQTVISQIATDVFGRGLMYYLIQGTTAILLAMAANTAFAGFPTMISIIARDGYAPRQFTLRGHRLNYSNGIIVLGLMAILLIIIFQGDTHSLIPLYAVGVFTSFTLAQFGMLSRWLRQKPKGWRHKALINGIGAVITLLTVIIIGVEKFSAGAWIVMLIIPILVALMLKVKNHYVSIAKQLDIPNERLGSVSLTARYKHHFIVPISSLNGSVILALRYARSLTPNVIAFHVETYEGGADKLRKKWSQLDTDVPLVIRFSPYREIIGPLAEYIDSEEHESKPGDMITVLLPQFIVSKGWEMLLHNNTSVFIANALFDRRHVILAVLPFYLEDLPGNKKQNNSNGKN
ncbi:MAG: amino acid permease [Peptococcaceae bacterium BICA1-7]|nr:MAG: amino acid permease [Peptococcaceae bacterium BICA1-7]HBV97834.1 amino acid permease [Desulfotomaculum sp.]